MNTITSVSTEIVQHDWKYSIHAVLNGLLTSQDCTHRHKSPALAEKCRDKVQARWDAVAAGAHTIKPVLDTPNLHEVRYSQTREITPQVFVDREVWCRFLFIKSEQYTPDIEWDNQETKETAE